MTEIGTSDNMETMLAMYEFPPTERISGIVLRMYGNKFDMKNLHDFVKFDQDFYLDQIIEINSNPVAISKIVDVNGYRKMVADMPIHKDIDMSMVCNSKYLSKFNVRCTRHQHFFRASFYKLIELEKRCKFCKLEEEFTTQRILANLKSSAFSSYSKYIIEKRSKQFNLIKDGGNSEIELEILEKYKNDNIQFSPIDLNDYILPETPKSDETSKEVPEKSWMMSFFGY